VEKRKQKIAILGYGVEGQAVYRYYSRTADRGPLTAPEITICDANSDLEVPEGARAQLGPDYLENLEQFDLLVRSPGVRPRDIKAMRPVTTMTREFMARCPAPVIGVTGTKGKGTTSALIARMLEAAGKKVWLGGNIGVPVFDFLAKVKPTDTVVFEMSSFQLMDVTRSPEIAVMLMIAPDHLNYHESMAEYTHAKGNIFRFQKPENRAVYNAGDEDATRLVGLSPGKHIPYCHVDGAYVKEGAIWYRGTRITNVDQVGLIGKHNLQNVCAAVAAVWEITSDPAVLAKAIKQFEGLPHRLQVVRTLGGIRFIDDSFAANPVAALSGMRAFPEPKIVILGGHRRGNDLTEMIHAVPQANVKHVVAIGETGPDIATKLKELGYNQVTLVSGGMPEIVHQAWELATEGETILLSPGCPSFDMFKNFEDRGNQFQAAVMALPGR
jgi:UDP-N-acetylmuramoylalanine--D-glutamate ligase